MAHLVRLLRAGIVLMAGGSKKTQAELMKEFSALESKDRLTAIAGDFNSKRKSAA